MCQIANQSDGKAKDASPDQGPLLSHLCLNGRWKISGLASQIRLLISELGLLISHFIYDLEDIFLTALNVGLVLTSN